MLSRQQVQIFAAMLVLSCFIRVSLPLPLKHFFSFGVHVGDNRLPVHKDSFGSLEFENGGFMVSKSIYHKAFVNSNGVLSLGEPYDNRYTPSHFLRLPAGKLGYPIIAPFWVDITARTFNKGDAVWYRKVPTNDYRVINKVQAIVREANPSIATYIPTSVLIATWDRIQTYQCQSEDIVRRQRNIIQCVLSSDGCHHTFVIFLYVDNKTKCHTRGNGRGSVCGHRRNGRAVESANGGILGAATLAGYDIGDSVNFEIIEGSLTNDMLSIGKRSNVGIPGVFVFDLWNRELLNEKAQQQNHELPSSADDSIQTEPSHPLPYVVEHHNTVESDYEISSDSAVETIQVEETPPDDQQPPLEVIIIGHESPDSNEMSKSLVSLPDEPPCSQPPCQPNVPLEVTPEPELPICKHPPCGTTPRLAPTNTLVVSHKSPEPLESPICEHPPCDKTSIEAPTSTPVTLPEPSDKTLEVFLICEPPCKPPALEQPETLHTLPPDLSRPSSNKPREESHSSNGTTEIREPDKDHGSCPIIGSKSCTDRVMWMTCQFLAEQREVDELPLPCQQILNNAQ